MRLNRLLLAFALLLFVLPAGAQYRQKYPLPTPNVPDFLGVNIHFTNPRPGEMEQLAAAGFKWIRMDFTWGGIERVRGQYNFAPYDGLMAQLDRNRIRPIFILDYGNDLYQQGSPRTDEARAAFARFAASSVTHFKGRGILWEMFNEPNIGFWKPTPSVGEYIALALATGKAIRQAAPDEWFIGPGVSGMDFAFIESCLRAGLLQYWDAVSFHPYRNSPPETAQQDFLHLRALIAQYSNGRDVPLISSEWGYSEKYPGLDLTKQSKYIARQALSNVASGLVVSIWYDWHDDGADPKEPEHHFGTVYPDYKPKPTYQSIATLTKAFANCRYSKRLALGSSADYCLLFTGPSGPKLAVWTTDPKPHAVHIAASPGAFKVTDYLGTELSLAADANGLPVTLTDAPQYLTPVGANALLGIAGRWRTLPQTAVIDTPVTAYGAFLNALGGDWTSQDRADFSVARIERLGPIGSATRDQQLLNTLLPGFSSPSVRGRPSLFRELGAMMDARSWNRLFHDLSLPFRSDTPCLLRVTIELKSGDSGSQDIVLVSRHPLRLLPQTAINSQLPVRIENPTGVPFSGRVRLLGSAPSVRTASVARIAPLEFKQGEKERTVRLPIQVRPDGSYSAGVCIETQFAGDLNNWTIVA